MDNLLELRNVSKHYPKFDLNNVSFEIPSGSIVGFIGRNGAGKTTTLKGIMNLLAFDSGEVIVFNQNMKDNEKEAKQSIGFSLSELSYYPNKTIKQIVDVTSKFYKNFDQRTFAKLCNHFNLDVTKKLEQLSSGMKVKYSLAIALSYKAKLLILDEPTSGLDPISRDEILDIFENIIEDKNRAILFSTHITSDLDKCATHIVYIKKGEIQFKGLKEEFVNRYKLVKGPLSELDKYKDSMISYKAHKNELEGLVYSDNKELESYLVSPTLEQIMIYLEKEGEDNEEFVI